MFQSLRDSLVRLADYLPTSRAALRRGLAALKRDDFTEALHVFQRLADAGNPEALHHLGWIHLHGVGVETDEEKGRMLLLASADAGYASAQAYVADCYRIGKHGFASSWGEAIAYAERAEAQGNDQGFLALLGLCEDMDDHDRAAALVRKWLDRPQLTPAGTAFLQRKLADYHSQGRGVPVDDDAAFALYQRAAAGGDEAAQIIVEALGGDARRHRSYTETKAYLQQYVAALPDPMPLGFCNGVVRTVRGRTLELDGYHLRLSCVIETSGPDDERSCRDIELSWPLVFAEKAEGLAQPYWFDQTDGAGNPTPRTAVVYLDPWDDRDRADPLFEGREWDDMIIPLWEAGANPDAACYENHEFIRALRHLHRLLGIAPASAGSIHSESTEI